jgi:hypothetical protein
MKIRLTIGPVLLLGILLVPPARAEVSIKVQVEVVFLLGYIEASGCDFYRNGTWHDPKAAEAHLRGKYRYLVARNLINTTEDFIDKAATRSSFTGQPYEVRCQGGASVMTNQWLRDELARFRAFNKRRPTSSLKPRSTRAGMSYYAPNASRLAAYSR